MADQTELLSLLLVEDNADDAELILRELRRSGFTARSRRVQTEQEYMSALAAGYAPGQPWDIILADYSLPDFSGLRALQLLRELDSDVPLIVVSGAIGEETAIEVMQEGASDYLLKDRLVRLTPAVRRVLEQRRLREEQRQAEEKYRRLFEYSTVGIYQTTPDGRYFTANPALAQIFGYDSPAELMANVTDLGGQVYLDPARRAEFRRRLETERSIAGFVSELYRKDGRTFWVSENARAVRDGYGTVLYYEGILEDITERKATEAALRYSEERFAKAFRASPAAVTLTRLADGLFVDANDQYLRLLSYELDEVVGHTATELNMYPDPATRAELVRKLRADGSVRNFEMDLQTKTGERRCVLFSTEEIELGGEAHILAILIDISERKQAEEALRQLNAELEARVAQRTADLAASEVKFRTMFSVLPVGVSILDDQRHVVDSNPSLARILKISTEGLARDAYAGRQFIYPGGAPLQPQDFPSARVVAEQQPVLNVEMGIITETGDTIWTDVSAAPLPVAGFSSVIVTADLTERKQIEQALIHERNQLQALMDNIPDTIYFKDRASRFTRVNLAQARFLGVASPELAVGQTDADYQAPHLATKSFKEEHRLLEMGEPLVDHLEYSPTPTGQPRWLSSTKVPLRDANGQVVGLVGISRDITERVKAEEQLQRLNQQLADRVDNLSRFNKLAEQLQLCELIEETYSLISDFMSQLTPSLIGALYVVSPDRSQVTIAALWGEPALDPQIFAPEDCWGLSRGELQLRDRAHPGLACPHLNDQVFSASLCIPLMSQGHALGVLHLRAPDEARRLRFEENTQQLALTLVVSDNIALTWANLALRETLRQQAIRDPLTGLFNRRFMEESLVRELHRAGRNHQSVGVIMIDVDHFKKVNDRFGHETGDAGLRALGRLLEACSRGSDIPCRYGGEEFLLILPEASIEIAGLRAEQIRERFRQLEFAVSGGKWHPVTLSLGVAAYPQHGEVLRAVLRAADAALYRAKSEGRDRTIVAPA